MVKRLPSPPPRQADDANEELLVADPTVVTSE